MGEDTLRLRPASRAASPTVLAERYRILEELGRGGMGVVYRALDLELGDTIAVKMLGRVPGPDGVERLRREVRIARRVTHRNVARIHDIGEDPTGWFLTMQLVEGTTLREELEARGSLPAAEALEIVAEVCSGVAAAHAAGVLHLDIKPENIMRTQGGGIVVLDFGVARLVGDDDGDDVVSGTPAYMAPEQRFGDTCDVRTDLYAIGVVLYELLTGARPAADEQTTLLPEVSANLRALVTGLIELLPERRPASATAVLDAIHRELGIAAVTHAARRPRRLRLAVLPLRDGRASGGGALAAGLTEELVDRLSALRDASVLTSTATARFDTADPIDPVAAGAALGVGYVVEGSVQRAGDRVRVGVRLVETAGGEIVWTDRFDAPVRDVLQLQDRIAQRIAEALRVELGTLPFRGVAPADAIELYMRARSKFVRIDLAGPHGAIADLERACELAPAFAPAIALHALSCARAWFYGGSDVVDEARTQALRAVARANAEAAGYPETSLAAGVLAFQGGDLATAIEQFERTLDVAPSQPIALDYSGRLLCEAGHASEGFRRIELASELDPVQWVGLLDMARHLALHRAWDDFHDILERIVARGGGSSTPMRAVALRVALWRNRPDDVKRAAADLELYAAKHRILSAHAKFHLGQLELDEVEAAIDEHLSHRVSRRFASLAHQYAAELAGSCEKHALALRHLELASSAGLFDLEWLDLCPCLAGARALDGFTAVRHTVRARVATVWR